MARVASAMPGPAVAAVKRTPKKIPIDDAKAIMVPGFITLKSVAIDETKNPIERAAIAMEADIAKKKYI